MFKRRNKNHLNFKKAIGLLTAAAILFSSYGELSKTILDEIIVSADEITMTGDINKDGNINVYDLIRAKSDIINNTDEMMPSSDVNADGVFNNKDVYEMEDYLLNATKGFSGDIKKAFADIDRTIVTDENTNTELQMTAEMADLADNLKTPLEVYRYVLNNVNTEFYYGSRKGAVGTYEQNGGNDYDQTSLLIAMLRYLGYEACYAIADIKLTDYDLCNIVATPNAEAAKKIFTSQGRKLLENTDGSYTTEQIFAFLTLDDKKYPLDTSFKYYAPNENQIDIEQTAKDLGLYDDNIDLYADYSVDIKSTDIFPVTKIIDQGINTLPETVPYSIAGENIYLSEEIETENSDIIEIDFNGLKISFTSANLYNKNLTIEYELTEESKFDLDIFGFNINSIDDLTRNLGTYAGYAQIYGVVKLDGKKIANGDSGLLGGKQDLGITIYSAGGSTTDYKKELTIGALYSIVFDYQMISPQDIAASYSKLPQKETDQQQIDENNVYGSSWLMDTMTLLGKSYFSQVDTNNEAVSSLSDVYMERSISAAIVEFIPDIYTQMGVSQLNKQGRFSIDVIGNAVTFISKKNDASQEAGLYHSTGFLSSFYESETLEQFTGQKAVSTAEVFNMADENDIDILYLSKANAVELESSKLSEDNKAYIKEYIESGNYVTVPAEEISVGSWNGTGYIVYDPATGMSTYIINNGLNGGSLCSWVGLAYLCDILSTVVECTWAFDAIMLGATVLGAGLVLLSGPIGAALIVSAIGLGMIVAGGFYLKNIGDRFNESTILMDDYINGDTDAGQKLKYQALWHGVLTGGGIAAGKYISKEKTAPFFKRWVESEIGYTASRLFENTAIGCAGAGEILMDISPKYAAMLGDLIDKYGVEVVDNVANTYRERGGVAEVKQEFEYIDANKPYYEKVSETDTINLSGKAIRITKHNPKDITNKINAILNNPKSDTGQLIEAKVADFVNKNNLDTIEQFGADVYDVNTKNPVGDIDIGTTNFLIEVKASSSAIKSNKINQFKKYTDMFYKDYFNFYNKKVILYVDREGLDYNSNSIKQIQDMGVKVVNSLEELMEAMK